MFWVTVCPSSGETTVYVTLGTCNSVWMTVWYVGWNEDYTGMHDQQNIKLY